MFKTKNLSNPTDFLEKSKVLHINIEQISQNKQREFLKFAISSRVSCFWNKILPVLVKTLDTLPLAKLKELLERYYILNLDNENFHLVNCFYYIKPKNLDFAVLVL